MDWMQILSESPGQIGEINCNSEKFCFWISVRGMGSSQIHKNATFDNNSLKFKDGSDPVGQILENQQENIFPT